MDSYQNLAGIGKDWSSYIERLDFFFEANNVGTTENQPENVRKREIFLSSIGDDTYQLLRGLIAPTKPNEKTFIEIIAVLNKHFEPSKSVIVGRFKFNTYNRKSGQSVTNYIAELKELARNCKFGIVNCNTPFTPQLILEKNLRDQLVCGISDSCIQRHLLSDSKLTYQVALDICLSMEAAEEGTQILSYSNSSVVNGNPVNKLQNFESYSKTNLSKCFRCGDTSHSSDKCRFKFSTCNYCSKVGHISKNCFKKAKAEKKIGSTNFVEINECGDISNKPPDDPSTDDANVYDLFKISSTNLHKSLPYYASLQVDGMDLH